MEVINTLQIKTYELTKEAKVFIIKNWIGREGFQLIPTFMNSEKEAYKNYRGNVFHIMQEIQATPE